MDTSYPYAPPVELERIAQPGQFLRSVHSIYRAEFRRWFGIMAPTSLLAGVVLVLADQCMKAINVGLHRGEIPRFSDIAAIASVRIGSFFLSWLLGCFALAAIATVVNDLDGTDDTEGWQHDSYQRAREHFGTLVALSLITFCAFGCGIFGMGFVETVGLRLIGRSHITRYSYAAGVIDYVVIAGVCSWIGVAIPIVLKGNVRVWAAIRESVELSNGYEVALFLLVVESVVGGMIAWYVVIRGLPILLPEHIQFAWWYSWVVNAAGLLASAAVDPPLFLGLSLLADPERFNGSLLRREVTT